MKYLINSQPKAGTFLCAALFEQFGIPFTRNLIQEKGIDQYFSDYDPNNRIKKEIPPSESLQELQHGKVTVAHLEHNRELADSLVSVKKVILTRDFKERKHSLIRWKAFARPTLNVYSMLNKAERIVPWKNEKNVFLMTFDDMIEENVEKINQLQLFLFNDIKFDSLKSIQNAKKSQTITKSPKRI